MAQKFKETAHLHTDLQKYGENYDRIFGKKDEEKSVEEIENVLNTMLNNEKQRIKNLAREVFSDLGSGQDTEGFPESSSFIYGFCKGYQAAKDGR